nr:hypothetical protein [Ruegeria sp. HKCCD8929]
MVALAIALILAGSALVLWLSVPWNRLSQWAAQEQRDFQNAMARALRAIRAGDAWAIWALCSATAAYGFVHALGPGHGQVLLGGTALASGATLRRMIVLTLASSLAQAGVAIFLVGGVALALGWATRDLVGMTEAWLAPASAIAISAIGVLLIVRGVRGWPRQERVRHGRHVSHCGCGHAHGPTVSEVQSLNSTREALALIGSVAVRPCTGALFVLVIALRMDVFLVGCLAVLTMSLGTAAFNLIVAGSGVAARRLTSFKLEGKRLKQFSAGLHIVGGALIAILSAGLSISYLDGSI